jgi:hypothetical protein
MTQPDPQVLAEAERVAIRAREIAWKLAGREPEDWAPAYLIRYRPLIRSRKFTRFDEEDDRDGIKAAKELKALLRLYILVEDKFGFQMPECVTTIYNELPDLIDFLKDQLLPDTAGGPIPDGRRRLCALTCITVWFRHRGKVQPFNNTLWEACEDYWQFSGQPETSKQSNLNTWQRFCEWAQDYDQVEDYNLDWFIEQYRK